MKKINKWEKIKGLVTLMFPAVGPEHDMPNITACCHRNILVLCTSNAVATFDLKRSVFFSLSKKSSDFNKGVMHNNLHKHLTCLCILMHVEQKMSKTRFYSYDSFSCVSYAFSHWSGGVLEQH